MLKIDIHTHIIPENLNEITKDFNDNRFISIKPINNNSSMLIKEDEDFRKINCNCWDHNMRLSDLEKTNVDIQVLSTIPILFSYWANKDDCLLLSKFLNNHLSNIVKNNNQFLGLGTIPMQDTDYAISEMDRCLNELNLQGIQIGTNVNGLNLSELQFDPIFQHAEKIGCPIFIHPWEMFGEKHIEKYWLPWLVGMPAETSRAICSLIFGGIFEKYPGLKICFAHGGGSFPFTIGRINHGFNVRPDLCAIDNNSIPSTYMKDFFVDSLVHDLNSMKFLIDVMGPNQILLGSDYPFPLGEQKPGMLIESMDLDLRIKQKIFSENALNWLGIKKSDLL